MCCCMLCKPQIVFLREQLLRILGVRPPSVYYIGGSDTLPPPLEKEEEDAAVAALEAGGIPVGSVLALASPHASLAVALREGCWDRAMEITPRLWLRSFLKPLEENSPGML